jgi:hypothetical protein
MEVLSSPLEFVSAPLFQGGGKHQKAVRRWFRLDYSINTIDIINSINILDLLDIASEIPFWRKSESELSS